MSLQFNASPYLEIWQRQQAQQAAQRPDPNLISQNLMQGLQGLADSRRQQQLMEMQQQKNAADMANDQQKLDLEKQKTYSEYGQPIQPGAMFAQPTNNAARSSFMPAGQGQVAQGTSVIDAFNQWRGGGMKTAAQPEFVDALSKDERKQFFDNMNPPTPKASAAAAGVTTGSLSWDTASPTQQNMAKALTEGRIRPSDLGLRDRATIVGLANEYSLKNNLPFSSYSGDVKAHTANYMASGKGGQNATSLNTALGHLSDAQDAFDKVGNTNQEWLNVPLNKLRTMTNDPNVVALNLNLNALRGELANVFKNGGGTDQEIASWSNYLNDGLTPAQYNAAAEKVNELLNSRLDALTYQQNDVMNGSGVKRSFLSPHGASINNRLNQAAANAGAPAGAPAGSGQNAMTASNPKTGQKIVSYDGGQTWQVK